MTGSEVKGEVFTEAKDIINQLAVIIARGVINKIKSGEKVNIKKAKRVVESMVDLILEEEQLLLGMTAIKDYDEYTYHHSVNVSILAVALAQRLGLSKRALTELGLVALFHDIGKIEIPSEVLNKPTSFTDGEWHMVQKHPFWGVRAILKMRGIDATAARAAIVAFEPGKVIGLKKNADAAMEDTPSIEKCLVFKRVGMEIKMKTGRDIDANEELEKDYIFFFL